ncbi:MAG: hypothetical protein QHJ34_03625 [bacterium]|nr:hypothetical protein [candidate division KSB1 bacterium]MDH7559304.1 hypothetical protein [bacterium]
METEEILRQGIQLLERLAAHDAQIEAKLNDGNVEELPNLVSLRNETLARLVAMAEELRAQGTRPVQGSNLHAELRRLADASFARSRANIALLQVKIYLLQKEREELQEGVCSLKRYLGAPNGRQKDLLC